MFIEIALILGALLALWWYVQPEADLKKYGNQIPGPNSYPIVGNLFNMPLVGAEALKTQFELMTKYGGLVRLWMGNELVVIVTDPHDVEVLLKSNKMIEKSKFYAFLNNWLGTGLLISAGQKWRSRRKAITPTFHFKILDNFIDIFNANGSILVERLASKVGQGSVDVLPFITAHTLDIICETSMGTQIGAQSGNNKEYQDAVREISELMSLRFNTPFLHNDLIWYLSGNKSKEDRLVKILKEQTVQVIRSKADSRKNRSETVIGTAENDEQNLGIKKKTAFLELLLEMKNIPDSAFRTDEDVQEEVDTFMFEGHDTTTSAICFALDLLALNPHCQEKLHDELVEKYGNTKACNPTMEDLNDLKYLDRVFKEVIRCSPSVPAIARQITENFPLPSGYTLPRTCLAMISIYQMHRNKQWFPNPDVFNPDNFLPEAVEKRHPFAYIPFSAGPRNCIGQKFATYEMKSTLIKLVKNFKFECDPDYEIVADSKIVLQSRNGHMLKLSKRD